MLLTPVANLPPVSTIPAANLPPVSTTQMANCLRCQQHRWQIMGTMSGCTHLKGNLKAKIYTCVNSTTQRCPSQISTIFSICQRCQPPPVVHLEPRISPRICEKNLKWPNDTQVLGGNSFMKKTRSRKSRDTVPLRWKCA